MQIQKQEKMQNAFYRHVQNVTKDSYYHSQEEKMFLRNGDVLSANILLKKDKKGQDSSSTNSLKSIYFLLL